MSKGTGAIMLAILVLMVVLVSCPSNQPPPIDANGNATGARP